MKKAILTIDDAPSKDFSHKISTLNKLKVPAVFFCTGSLMETRRTELIEAIHLGFVIGNHGYHHYHFSKLSLRECEKEIKKTTLIIDDIYRQAGVARPVKWFRFPYGDKADGRLGNIFQPITPQGKEKKKAVQQMLLDLGYGFNLPQWLEYDIFSAMDIKEDTDWTWTFDLLEWCIALSKPVLGVNSIDKIIGRMEEKDPLDCRGEWPEPHWLANVTAPEIILTHDHDKNTLFFESLIEKLLTIGFDFPSIESILLSSSQTKSR